MTKTLHGKNYQLDKNLTWTKFSLGLNFHLDENPLDKMLLGQKLLGQKVTWTKITWTKIGVPISN